MSTTDPATAPPAAPVVRPLAVGDLARPAVTTVEPRAHLAAAAYLLRHAGDGALVVLRDADDRVPLGLVTDADVAQAVADGRDPERVRISDVVSGPAVVVERDTTVAAALDLVLERGLIHLPVVDGGRLVGIVGMADLCRAVLRAPADAAQDGPGVLPG
ncbi:cyclic nucleotide-binding/CBS domain-containing protein [Geodermatophilus sp. SYSU D01045]